MENKRPLSPHIQIYRWHVSSLVSISHRMTGIINIIAITLICLWVSLIFISENNYEMINLFLSSKIGKFIILGLTWSFSFQILSEIRHLIMDLGYGFELKTSKITGLLVIFGSLILTVIFYVIGKNLIQHDKCNEEMDLFKNKQCITSSTDAVVHFKLHKNL